MQPELLIAFAFLFFGLAVLGAVAAPINRPGLFLSEPRRTIERLLHAILWTSPSDSDIDQALRLVELVASSGQDASRAASIAGTLLERRNALVMSWGDQLGRFAKDEGDPASLGCMPELPTQTTPQNRVIRAKAWISTIPQPATAAIALGSARAALRSGIDPAPALAEARAILARHAISLQLALDELRAIR